MESGWYGGLHAHGSVDADLLGLVGTASECADSEKMSVHLFVDFCAVVGDCPLGGVVVVGGGECDDEVVVAAGVVPDLLAECLVGGALCETAVWVGVEIAAEAV